jgi:hypothetical protein
LSLTAYSGSLIFPIFLSIGADTTLAGWFLSYAEYNLFSSLDLKGLTSSFSAAFFLASSFAKFPA